MKRNNLRMASLLLSICMLMNLLPLGAFASMSGITGVVPTDEYTFLDFEDFKDMCQDAQVFEETMICVYTGYVDFEISEDITIPQTVTIKTDGAGIVIPSGVTVTLEGALKASDLQIFGKLCNFGRLELTCEEDPAMTVADPTGYQDCDGEKQGAIYVEAIGDSVPENSISGLDMSAFASEKVTEGENTFWKFTIAQSESECSHSWSDADCDTPKTCTLCGETEGDVNPAVHAFTNSVCTDCGAIRIDEITFPDANFRAYITSQTYGADGLLTRKEVQNVTSIDVSEKNISDLTGIEHFIELTALVCSDNRLTKLNVSKNTELATLWCYNNQLTELDVSKNTELVKFECHNNQLTSLDVTNLTGVEILICSDNQLIALDVSKNTTLTDLLCSDNQLAELDVSGLAALEYLNCSSNQLTELDVNGLTKLRGLVCFENQLTSLDVDGCNALRSLICDNNQLTSLDVRSLTVLETLDCSSNLLTSLDVSNCTVLEELYCYLNQLTSLNVSGCTALKDLHCSSNQLTDLDVSGCTVLIHLSCSDNQLTDLDVSRCTALEDLSCYYNQLTSLDVSGLAALKILGCSSNQREISVIRNQFDLSNLAADGFDISKASAWQGGTVTGNILTTTGEKVTYNYNLGNGETETFTLVIDRLCSHTWTPADCINPKTCSLCGATEGAPLGHDWQVVADGTGKICGKCGATQDNVHTHTWLPATCTAPETCTSCGVTRGEKQPHTPVVDPAVEATCTTEGKSEGKHCSVCGIVTVAQQTVPKKDHTWLSATCIAPKTCERCGTTEGSPDPKAHNMENGSCNGCGVLDDNPYFTDFSVDSSILAPGITQQIHKATTVDGKQVVYYTATADVNSPYVSVYANYKDNDPSLGWGMQRVIDQANAAQAKYGEPNSEQYIDSYNVIAAINGAGYNMTTGEPSGVLMMGGVEYHAPNGAGFFGILKDGTACAGSDTDYYALKAQGLIRDANSIFGTTLIKDGKIAVTATDNYYTDRASRTAIGYTKTGKVVFMVMDGRQEPVSCGGSAVEIAQVMLEAGCVYAVNLDGGGSSTYVARQPGDDKLSLVSSPSDGFQRSVSTSWMMVFTAPASAVCESFGHVWADADCENAKTCSRCGETEGEALDHNWLDATCTAPETCSRCGETEGAPLNHNWTPADCENAKTCKRCGATEGSALNHDWTPADCKTAKTCKRCGETEGKSLGHNWLDATCTTPKTCSICAATQGNKLGHDWKPATCTENSTCKRCGKVSYGTMLPHTEVIDHAVAATCTTAGKTEGSHCAVCGKVLKEQDKIPAMGHTPVVDAAVEATCSTEGRTAGAHCVVCGEVLKKQETIAKKDHTWKAATCSNPKTCTACGATSGYTLGHDWAPGNCTTPKTCTACGTKDGGVVHAYEHQYDYKCDLCGTTRTVDMTRPMVDMFRMYDPNSGEHFYTGSMEERENLVAVGWQYEGVGFTFPLTTGKPVHRLYDPVTGEHLYTMDEDEMNMLLAQGWNYEGIAFNSGFENEVPQYRLHNPNATRGAYHFTASIEERDNLIALGWEYQGIGWYSLGG